MSFETNESVVLMLCSSLITLFSEYIVVDIINDVKLDALTLVAAIFTIIVAAIVLISFWTNHRMALQIAFFGCIATNILWVIVLIVILVDKENGRYGCDWYTTYVKNERIHFIVRSVAAAVISGIVALFLHLMGVLK